MKPKLIENKVLEVLKEHPRTRKDDFILILEVYKSYGVADYTFQHVMTYHSLLGLPSMHTITRARRKLFEKYPELKPQKITELRAEEEKEFRSYALNN